MASFSFPVMPESRAGSPEPVPGVGLVSFFMQEPPWRFVPARNAPVRAVGSQLSAVSRDLPPATCHLTYHPPPVTCHLPPATCHLSPATCHLSPEDVNCG